MLAEGVETEQEVRLLLSLRIDLFQGYYFGRPQPVPEINIPQIPFEAKLNLVEQSNSLH